MILPEADGPVAGFELDSVLHDSDEARERGRLKDELFSLAAMPLLRIRADDTTQCVAKTFTTCWLLGTTCWIAYVLDACARAGIKTC